MIVKHLRRGGLRCAVALSVTGLMLSGPVQAIEIDQAQADRLLAEPVLGNHMAVDTVEQSASPLPGLSEIVADLVDPAEIEPNYVHLAEGQASYYGRELAGNRTASGERFDPHGMTAAHRTLPMGSKIRVTNIANGRSVIVRINDRGPFARGRIIDVSLAAAREIRMIGAGTAKVRLEQLV